MLNDDINISFLPWYCLSSCFVVASAFVSFSLPNINCIHLSTVISHSQSHSPNFDLSSKFESMTIIDGTISRLQNIFMITLHASFRIIACWTVMSDCPSRFWWHCSFFNKVMIISDFAIHTINKWNVCPIWLIGNIYNA